MMNMDTLLHDEAMGEDLRTNAAVHYNPPPKKPSVVVRSPPGVAPPHRRISPGSPCVWAPAPAVTSADPAAAPAAPADPASPALAPVSGAAAAPAPPRASACGPRDPSGPSGFCCSGVR